MAGIRNVVAHRLDDDIVQLKQHMADYFALENQAPNDVDIRTLFCRWLVGQILNSDETTARAMRHANLLSHGPEWGQTLVSIDGRAGA